jgi:hypothetical protein
MEELQGYVGQRCKTALDPIEGNAKVWGDTANAELAALRKAFIVVLSVLMEDLEQRRPNVFRRSLDRIRGWRQ